MSNAHTVLKLLSVGIDTEGCEELKWRYEAMCSELNYLSEKKPEVISAIALIGWSRPKLEVVFCLNSFYQRILAPLISAGQGTTEIGRTTPIRYGRKLRFDGERSQRLNEMDEQFGLLCMKFEITQKMLEAARTSDLVWYLNNKWEEGS